MERTSPLRAEHASVASYLNAVLDPAALARPLIASFNDWDFAQAALADISLSLHAMGSTVTVAQWADETPLHDVGWTTDRRFARLLATKSLQQRAAKGMRSAGLPAASFVRPPIRSWSPVEPIPWPDRPIRSLIRPLTYRGAAMGRAVLQVTPDRDTPVSDEHLWPTPWLRAAMTSYAYVYDQTLQLIDDRGITCVIAYNGRFLHDSAVAAAAETRGLPVLSFDTGGAETAFDLTIDATHDWAALQDRMLALYQSWPQDERDALGSRWFLDRAGHRDPRNAEFTDGQEIGVGITPPACERLIVYFSSSGDEISELDLDWDAFFGGQEEALGCLAQTVRELPGAALVVRSHPHKRRKPRRDVEDWLAAVERAQPDLHLDPFSDVDSYALMQQADVVVTYGSTTGVEAAFARRPVIVMGPSAYERLGCATPVSTMDELRHAVATAESGWWPGSVAYGLMMMRRGFVYEHVELRADGVRVIGGVPLTEARPLARHLSHALDQRIQRRLRAAA